MGRIVGEKGGLGRDATLRSENGLDLVSLVVEVLDDALDVAVRRVVLILGDGPPVVVEDVVAEGSHIIVSTTLPSCGDDSVLGSFVDAVNEPA